MREVLPDDYLMGMLLALSTLSYCGINCGQAMAVVKKRKRNRHRTLVAVHEDGSILGTASVLFEDKLTRDGCPAAHIEDVAVQPDWQGKGVGKALVDACVELSRAQGCYKVVLDCAEDKVAFYKKCGFHDNGVAMRMDL